MRSDRQVSGCENTRIQITETFDRWLKALRDLKARARIDLRIRRLEQGNAGDVRPVGMGISELRIDAGPGYRVHFVHRGHHTVILFAGGDTSSQLRDIELAQTLWKRLRDEEGGTS